MSICRSGKGGVLNGESITFACPACNTLGQSVTAFERGEIDFRICGKCGALFREQMPSEEELKDIYLRYYSAEQIETGNTCQESGEYALRAYSSFIVRRFPTGGGTVLDYGAGTGRLVQLLRDAKLHAMGIEFSADARSYCSEHRGFSLLGGISDLGAARYDLITMIEVIEHLPLIHEELKRIRSCIKDGGSLLITTPNRLGLRGRIEKGTWKEARKKFHLVLFDRRSLENVLRGVGFSSIEWVMFSPVQKPGAIHWVYARMCQMFGLGGTLCAIARGK